MPIFKFIIIGLMISIIGCRSTKQDYPEREIMLDEESRLGFIACQNEWSHGMISDTLDNCSFYYFTSTNVNNISYERQMYQDSILVAEGFEYWEPKITSILGFKLRSNKRRVPLREGKWRFYSKEGVLLKEVIYIRGMVVKKADG